MLDTINGALGFNSDLFETNPNENGAADMISDNSCFATLISFDASQLLGFSVKLLNLPSKAAQIMYDLRVVLLHLVCHDIVRALGRQHYSEDFHLMLGREPFDFDRLALLLFLLCPLQTINPLVRV